VSDLWAGRLIISLAFSRVPEQEKDTEFLVKMMKLRLSWQMGRKSLKITPFF